jgi:cysteine-rich repeat protein
MRARTLAALLAPALACFNPSGASTSSLPDPGSSGDDATTSPDVTTSGGAATGSTTRPDETSGATSPGVCGDGHVDIDEECDDGNELDNDACLSTCRPAICGDGTVCDTCGEQCDDANGDPLDNCDQCQYVASLLVFVTPQPYPADQVYPPDADIKCNALGKSVKATSPFFAWVGSATFDPRTNIDNAPLDLPYVRADGKVVATGAADLLDGTLLAPIDMDQSGLVILTGDEQSPCSNPANYAWTGTRPDGINEDPDCDGWTSNLGETKARVGNLLSTAGEWTSQASCTFSCDKLLRIYCFEKVL